MLIISTFSLVKFLYYYYVKDSKPIKQLDRLTIDKLPLTNYIEKGGAKAMYPIYNPIDGYWYVPNCPHSFVSDSEAWEYIHNT